MSARLCQPSYRNLVNGHQGTGEGAHLALGRTPAGREPTLYSDKGCGDVGVYGLRAARVLRRVGLGRREQLQHPDGHLARSVARSHAQTPTPANTPPALLDFDTPRGLRLNLSSLSSPHFATSYALGSVGLVDGSLSYLYSSLPLTTPSQSATLALPSVVRGYRPLRALRAPDDPRAWERWRGGRRVDARDVLLYGRLYLPQSTLEALYVRRLSPARQLRLSAVSDARLRNGGTLLALLQRDVGKYSTEALYSTDGGLLGVRGLYNFGADPRRAAAAAGAGAEAAAVDDSKIEGRFSAGAEVYYGALNKSGGVSVGGRFATLPGYRGMPLTATLTLNPPMGSVSATYAVRAGERLALCSRFEFNAYSYESDVVVGCELWREGGAGVLKARVDRKYRVGVLWEGRVKDFLVSAGSALDLRARERPFRSVGLELQYSS